MSREAVTTGITVLNYSCQVEFPVWRNTEYLNDGIFIYSKLTNEMQLRGAEIFLRI